MPIRGHIAFHPDYVILLGSGLVTAPHRHLSASVTFSLDEPFLFKPGRGSEGQLVRMLAMRPDTLHAIDAGSSTLLNVQVDPETHAYARLRGKLLATHNVVVREELEPEVLAQLRALASARPFLGVPVASFLIEHFGAPSAPKIFDRRIAQALSMLKATFPDAPSSSEIAHEVGLSESRLMHLFREQVGVPLRRYTLWLRVRHVLFCVATGDNLTDAAHAAGFADSPHLSRVFSAMFGMPASSLIRSEHVTRSFELPQMPMTGPHAAQDFARIQRLLSKLAKPPAV